MMKRRIKKITALVLVFILTISISTTAFAAENQTPIKKGITNEGGRDFDNLLPCIYAVALDATNFGYSISDFETVSIGEKIHTYEWLDSNKLRENDFSYYPVFSGDKLLFLICENEDGTVQMTQGFTDVISEYIGREVAIIYDIDEAYIVIDDLAEMQVAYQYESVSNVRGNITNKDQIKSRSIKWQKLEGIENINVFVNLVEPVYDATMPTVTVAVPKVLQNYSNICWAASTASIGNYLKGKSYTDVNVAKELYGSNFNKTASLMDSSGMLLHIYGIKYKKIALETAPTESRIYNNISSGYPLYGRWKSSSGSTHQTVIRGINHTSGYIYLMDPEQGYVTAKRTSNGGFSYVGKNGYTLKLIGYLSMY